MKKNFMYAMMGVIALSGGVLFTGCSSEDEVTNNPDYNPEENTVKTQFTIAFPGEISGTRMTSSIVQEGASTDFTKFRGISNIVLIPYASSNDRTNRLGDAISFSSMIKPNVATSPNTIPSGSNLTAASNSVLYKDVTIPSGTSGFLFYGEATGTENNFATGSIVKSNVADNTKEASTFTFALQPIKATEDNIEKTNSSKIIAYLTQIAAAADATDATITWAKCADATNNGQSWYSEGLGALYTQFINNHAGSTATVKGLVQHLYTAVRAFPDGSVKTAIINAILNTYATDDGNTGTLTFTESLGANYPEDNNLPDGSAAIEWETTSPAVPKMIYTGSTTGLNIGSMIYYTYPASLYYRVDSDIKTANASMADNYDGSKDWTTILNSYTGTSVGPTTKSVAITKPIQYSVARLDVGIYAESEKLYDAEGVEVPVTANTSFPVTGVIVGGQPISVNYLFSPSSADGGRSVYDKTMNTTFYANYSASEVGVQNHTLVMETYPNQTVNLIIELQNNSGKDFLGYTGVIPKGTKFYLAAVLDPQNIGTNSTNENDITRVFEQDYTTTAILKIKAGALGTPNAQGLGAAYNIIPDLRTTQMELGMSVDLSWKAGIVFRTDL